MSKLRRSIRQLGLLVALVAWPAGVTRAAALDCQGTPGEVRLIVLIEGARSREGLIDVTVYPDDPQRFLKRGGPIRGLSGLTTATETPVTRMCIWLQRPGAYAISVYHDADSDGRFDQSFIGLPKEGYGFSNNPSTLVGPPSFRAARFVVREGDVQIIIRLSYFG